MTITALIRRGFAEVAAGLPRSPQTAERSGGSCDAPKPRQADPYRDGNVFLVGNSAHMRSAMGGPGLNLGLQDGVNLGWKLAAAVNNWTPAELLATYH